jgi:hypothetical protein
MSEEMVVQDHPQLGVKVFGDNEMNIKQYNNRLAYGLFALSVAGAIVVFVYFLWFAPLPITY